MEWSVWAELRKEKEQAIRNKHTHTDPVGENKVEKS